MVTSPSSASSTQRRHGWHGRPAIALYSLLGLIALVLLVCEIIGWRFLKDPLQRKLAESLGVDVVIEAPFDLHLLRPPQLSVGSLRIGAPQAVGVPFLIDARDALLQWRWRDLWAYRQGEPLRIKRLEAHGLEVYAKRIDADTASWKFASKSDSSTQPMALPQFDVLRLNEGLVHVDDKLLQLVLELQVRLNERARADGLPGTPWRLAHAVVPSMDDLQFGFAPPAGAAPTGEPAPHTALLTVAAADAAGFNLDAEGSYRKLPVTASLRAPKLMPLLSSDAEQAPVMVMARASVGQTHMSYDGASVDLSGRGLAGDFTLSGPSLAAVGEPFKVTLPTTGPFALQGHLSRPDGVWKARIDEAKIGRSQLAGDFAYDPNQAVPKLSGKLTGKRLALADLGPAVGAEPRPPEAAASGAASKAKASNQRRQESAKAVPKPQPKPEGQATAANGARRVIPDRRFDLPSLRAMNADVGVALDELDLNTSALETLRPMKARVLLQDGVLHLQDIDARTAGGSLAGSTSLDANTDPAKWKADLSWKGVDLAGWLAGARKSDSDVTGKSSSKRLKQERKQARAGKSPVTSYLTGELRGSLKLTGEGNSTAQILGSADGQLQAMINDGTISHLAMEVMGLDVAQALGMLVKGDDSLPLACAVVAIDAKNGQLTPRVAVFDTNDSTVSFGGNINLGSEAMDLRGTVRPKDFTFLSLRTPLLIRGTFGAPSVSLEPVPLAGRVAAGAALALINPFAAILPFLDPGDGKKADGCRKLAAQTAMAAK